MTTVVITGAAGFVGRHLAAYLTETGVEVLPLSRQVVAGMVRVDDYRNSPAGDAVVHLAEPDRANASRDGDAVIRNSAEVASELARRFKGRVVYASSTHVYGDDHSFPCRVDTPVLGTDVYSTYKLLNEQIILDAGGAVARISNLVGPGMAANMVVSDILSQVPGSGPVRVRDGAPICDFLPVEDAAAALGLMALSAVSGIVNVGSGVGTSVNGLARLLLAIALEEHRVVVATNPSSRQSVNVLDISETTRILGWSPVTTLEKELTRLIRDKSRTS